MGKDALKVALNHSLKRLHGHRAALTFPTATSVLRALNPDPASCALPTSVPTRAGRGLRCSRRPLASDTAENKE